MSKPTQKLLVVEDDNNIRRMVGRFFKLNGYQISEALDLEEAMEHMKSGNTFDVVLLDVHFPGGGAAELLPDLRALSRDAVIVLITATEDHALLLELLASGATDVVTKPFDVTMLLGRVESHLQATG